MKRSVFLLLSVLLLIPVICLAAPKKKKAASKADDRGLTAVSKSTGDGRRVALVIGNGAYRHTDSMPRLANPVNDAEDIAAALRGFGFTVVEKKNLTREQMDDALADFGRRITNSDTALFYFAGHGLQVKGQNYLVPVDAKIETEAQVPHRTVNVNQLLEEMDNSKSRVNIVMLDACRNNPISGKFRSGATRGLAAPASSPKGTVIVYATDPGNVAADGDGRNGLFTAGLLTAFKSNDLTLFGVLTKASEVVEAGSNRSQTPYINGPATVQKNFSFAPGQSAPPQVAMAPRPQAPPPRPAVSTGNFTDPTTGMEFVSVPQGFSIGKYEVTQGQWRKVMGSNPSGFSSCGDNCPVERVSWNDAQQFISKLNSMSGANYRLPTEAEWEYACHADNNHEYCGSSDLNTVAWYDGNSSDRTHPVGQNQANSWGIYDMSGNVWEWVQDSEGSGHVFRGGGWGSFPSNVRASYRYIDLPGFRSNTIGFRLVSPVQ